MFQKSAKEIAKKMEENYYDLNSEICGIKKGSIRNKANNSSNNNAGNTNKNIDLKQDSKNGGKNRKKGCC